MVLMLLYIEVFMMITMLQDLVKKLHSGLHDKDNLDHLELQPPILKDTNEATLNYLKQDGR